MSGVDLRLSMPGLFLLRGRYRAVHMIGVLGAGMAALAEILVRSGFVVTGTDPKGGDGGDYLRKLGVAIAPRAAAGNVPPEAIVVHSAAVPKSHPELRAARRRRQPILPRGSLLSLLMRGATGIAIAGSHGKSTTAGLIAYLLAQGGLSPVAAVGARLPGQRGNALVGKSPILVAEVDESDGTIDRVEPMAVVLTSIDREHLDCFSGSFRELQAAFRRLAMRVPVSGAVIVPGDDDRALRLVRSVSARSISAGLREGSLVRGEEVFLDRGRYAFTVRYCGKRVCKARIALPGLMNVKNALLAAAAGARHLLARRARRGALLARARRRQAHGRPQHQTPSVRQSCSCHRLLTSPCRGRVGPTARGQPSGRRLLRLGVLLQLAAADLVQGVAAGDPEVVVGAEAHALDVVAGADILEHVDLHPGAVPVALVLPEVVRGHVRDVDVGDAGVRIGDHLEPIHVVAGQVRVGELGHPPAARPRVREDGAALPVREVVLPKQGGTASHVGSLQDRALVRGLRRAEAFLRQDVADRPPGDPLRFRRGADRRTGGRRRVPRVGR